MPGPMLQERVWSPGIRCSSSACSNFKSRVSYHLILLLKPFFLLELNLIPQSTHFLLSRSFVLVWPAVTAQDSQWVIPVGGTAEGTAVWQFGSFSEMDFQACLWQKCEKTCFSDCNF
jgi:hypothetical protein